MDGLYHYSISICIVSQLYLLGISSTIRPSILNNGGFSMLADITDQYLESDTKVIEDIMVYNARERIIQLILEEKANEKILHS